MKKGIYSVLLIAMTIISLLLGTSSVINAEEKTDTEQSLSTGYVDKKDLDSQEDERLTDQPVDKKSMEKQADELGFSVELDVVEKMVGEYNIILGGIPNTTFDAVVLKVWSDQKNEDDVFIYVAQEQDDNTLVGHVSIKNHKHLGLYHVFAYGLKNSDGIVFDESVQITEEMLADSSLSTELAQSSFETIIPKGGIVSAPSNCAQGIITAKLEGIENNDAVKAVRFHIWSKNNQSDFRFYTVPKNETGVYSVDINLKDFKNSPGVYQIRAYSIDMVNELRFHGKAAVNMLATTSSLDVTIPSSNNHFRTITATDVEAPCGVQEVRFSVWSDVGGRDDLQWYSASKSGSVYSYTFDVRNHKSPGLYYAYVYVISKNGVSRRTKTASFSVSEDDLRSDPVQGIDVSKHNGTIDWGKVKSAGIKFAIIRCGYGDNLSSQDDTQWTRNVAQCESLGIPYGVYIYSYSTNVSQAKSEAEHCIRLLKGHNPQYPVFLDLEDECMSGLSNAQLLQITVTWAEKIKAAGYTPGVYSSKYWWTNRLTSTNYNNYKRWVAQWNSQCTYTGTYCMWQYSSTGRVNGISGNVDMDYAY